MKKILGIVLLLGICLTFYGCSEDKKIGFTSALPTHDEIVEIIKETESINAISHAVDNNGKDNNTVKPITDEKKVDEIIKILSKSTEIDGSVVYMGRAHTLELRDKHESLLYYVGLVPSYRYVIFELNETIYYEINEKDMETLLKIITD